MKSEERHRLNTNQLGVIVQNMGDALEKHATAIVGVFCVLLVVGAGATWWWRQSSASSTAAWTLLESAENVGDYGNVAEKYKNTPAGNWALLRSGELNLKSGIEAMFTDRELALTDLKRSREAFDQLLASASAGPLIRERAAWGMARCLEATSDGDTTKAMEAYQRLITEFPDTIYKPYAEERITALKTGGAKEFYAWFSKQNPKPADIRPKDGTAKDTLDPFFLPSPGDKGSEGDKPKGEGAESAAPTGGNDKAKEIPADKPAGDETNTDKAKEEVPPARQDESKPDKTVEPETAKPSDNSTDKQP